MADIEVSDADKVDLPCMEIDRLTVDEMREIVRARLACEVLFSSEVPEDLMGSVFMPLVFGAMRPPEEVIEARLGSASPPEVPDHPGEAPKHPGYPEPPPTDAPTKPVPSTVPEDAARDLEWGDLTDEEFAGIEAGIKAENDAKHAEWEKAHREWEQARDQHSQACSRIDAEHEVALAAWDATVKAWDEAKAKAEAEAEAWLDGLRGINEAWLADVGVLMGRMKDAMPRSINGYPLFPSFKIIHKDDWTRIEAAIIREQERASEIEV